MQPARHTRAGERSVVLHCWLHCAITRVRPTGRGPSAAGIQMVAGCWVVCKAAKGLAALAGLSVLDGFSIASIRGKSLEKPGWCARTRSFAHGFKTAKLVWQPWRLAGAR